MYHFAAATVEEKNSWFQELHSKILTQKRLFRQLLSHLSVPDKGFFCMKAKAKVKYLGMFEDELSFKSGDEILVVGFKDGTGRWRPVSVHYEVIRHHLIAIYRVMLYDSDVIMSLLCHYDVVSL